MYILIYEKDILYHLYMHICIFFTRRYRSKVSFATLDFYCYRISFIFILLVFQTVYSENSDVFKQITAKHLDRILKKCIWVDKDVKCQKEKSFVLDVAGCCKRMLHYWSSTITFILVSDIPRYVWKMMLSIKSQRS